MTTETELCDFLRRTDRLNEPPLLFAPRLNAEWLLQIMQSVFGTRHVFSLRTTGAIPPTAEEIGAVIRNSFDGAGILAVLIDAHASAEVVQAVSRLCTHKELAEKKDGVWTHRKAPREWRMVVLAEVSALASLPGEMGELFPAVMAL